MLKRFMVPGQRPDSINCALAAVVLLVGIGACGGDSGPTPPTQPPPPPPPPPVAPVQVGTIPNQTIETGQTATLDVVSYFRDPDGGALTYAAASSTAGVVSVSVSGSTLTMVGVADGTATVTVTATDPGGLSAAQSFQVTVETPNRAPEPVGTIPNQTVGAGEAATLDVVSYFRDPDEDALTYTATTSAAGVVSVSVSGSTLTMVGVAAGTAAVTVTAHDRAGLTASQSFSMTVMRANRAPEPVGTMPNQTVDTGQTAALDVATYFRDPDGDALTYTATSSADAVASASVSGSTLTIAGTAAGSATVTVTARDPGGLTATQSTGVTVRSDSDYVPLSGLRITASGGFSIGGINLGTGCLSAGTVNVGGVAYQVHWTEWQVSTGSEWSQVSGTRREGQICGYDLATAAAGEYRLAGEMSVNGVRGRYRSENTVTVRAGGGAGFRDDFTSSASLADWEILNADAAIVDGVLRVTNNRAQFFGAVGRDLESPLSVWTLRVSMGRAQRDGLAGVWWGTGIRRYPLMSFNTGPIAGTNFSMWVRDADEEEWLRLADLSGNSDAINDGLNELAEITLGWDGEEVFLAAGDTDLVRGRPDETLATLLEQILFVSLVMEGDVGRTALFDWAEVTGTESSADAASQAETPEWIQSLRVPKKGAASGVTSGGLDTMRIGRSRTRSRR